MDRLRQVLYSPLGKRKTNTASSKVFGVSLEDSVRSNANTDCIDGTLSSPNIPFVVDRICRYLFANGE